MNFVGLYTVASTIEKQVLSIVGELTATRVKALEDEYGITKMVERLNKGNMNYLENTYGIRG